METKRCIVVGGGSIALRKIEGLLEASAQVTVISPAFCPEISELINEGKISALERPYQFVLAPLPVVFLDDGRQQVFVIWGAKVSPGSHYFTSSGSQK